MTTSSEAEPFSSHPFTFLPGRDISSNSVLRRASFYPTAFHRTSFLGTPFFRTQFHRTPLHQAPGLIEKERRGPSFQRGTARTTPAPEYPRRYRENTHSVVQNCDTAMQLSSGAFLWMSIDEWVISRFAASSPSHGRFGRDLARVGVSLCHPSLPFDDVNPPSMHVRAARACRICDACASFLSIRIASRRGVPPPLYLLQSSRIPWCV